MSFESTTEKEIFNALFSKETKFVVDGVEFKEKLITGTHKERERACKKRAKELAKLL